MLTKNWTNYVLASNAGISYNVTNTAGSTVSQSGQFAALVDIHHWRKNGTSGGVAFSFSISEPSSKNFSIDKVIGSDKISVIEPSGIISNNTEDFFEISVTFGVNNISKEVVTINSVYYTRYIWGSEFVMDYSKLKTPIVLNKGESKQITYTIRFNYPKAGA